MIRKLLVLSILALSFCGLNNIAEAKDLKIQKSWDKTFTQS